MAQTGSAQREPSMEEILASIRRIIEDSDGARPPLGSDAQFEVVSSDHKAQPLSQDTPHPEVEAFRAELDDVEKPVAGLSMAEIQATVNLAAEPEVEEAQPTAAPWSAEVRPLRMEAPAAADTEAVSTSTFLRPEPVHAEEAPVEPSADVAPVDGSEAASEKAPVEQRPAIISDQTGRQVAAAFGELSEAFAASRRRSFDEMAEEMLRPMLQDWLDNNLPLLVERLVREEIERVARGG
jgi:cell pole-organizing protein PopZ